MGLPGHWRSVTTGLLYITTLVLPICLYSKLKERQTCLCAYVTQHYATKTYGEVDVQARVFLSLALVKVSFLPGCFTQGEMAPVTH